MYTNLYCMGVCTNTILCCRSSFRQLGISMTCRIEAGVKCLMTLATFTSPASTLSINISVKATTPDRPTPALQCTTVGDDESNRFLSDRSSLIRSMENR